MTAEIELSEPVPHSGNAEIVLREALKNISEEGCLVAFFPSGSAGKDGFCLTGVEAVLSRLDLHAEEITPAERGSSRGWTVSARRRPKRVSPRGEARRQRREKAEQLNASGEQLFVGGDIPGAIAAFAEAVATCSDEPVFLNNLGTALDVAGRTEDAWKRIREALHLDPSLASARDNLRVLAIKLGREREADSLLRLYGRDNAEA